MVIRNNGTRLVFNIDHLREMDPTFAADFLQSPLQFVLPFEAALKDAFSNADADYSMGKEFHFGVEGSLGRHHTTPRGLSSDFLGNMVAVEGIVTKVSLVRPKVVKSVHYCEATEKFHSREYRDGLSTSGLPTSTVYPTRDDDGNVLTTEFGLCVYKDHQTVSMQEMPERSPPGQLPRSVDVVMEYDLVDRCKPGDRVQLVGIYKPLPATGGGATNGIFRTVLLANHIRVLGKDLAQPTITESDIQHIRELARGPQNIVDLLASSIAPSICGHEMIKKSLLLLLMGGVEKNLVNGMHIRGDINMLMVGDPSTAKSQLLRFVLNIAPLAINTTGRGSSGVGLTAAVTTDETGERKLEAGAMVLADRGVVCIDEFDKMSEIDRVAIHEVMEQQTVTIAKAGIHATLNARCSVVAAANPVYGQYNRDRTPMQNIGLPDSLLSRFDVLFIVLDTVDNKVDKTIADHVLRMHRYRISNQQDTMEVTDDFDSVLPNSNDDQDTPVYQKYDRLLHGTRGKKDIISTQFLKKFIYFAKSRFKPVLSDEAQELISSEYADLRSHEGQGSLPITARCLETMIRLACAHAKCRLSNVVNEEDALVACEIVEQAFSHDDMHASRKRRGRRGGTGADSSDESTDDDEGSNDGDEAEVEVEGVVQSSASRRRGAKRRSSAADAGPSASSQKARSSAAGSSSKKRRNEADTFDFDEEEEAIVHAMTAPLASPNKQRMAEFKKAYKAFTRESGNEDNVALDALLTFANKGKKTEVYTAEEAGAILRYMDEVEGVIMFRDNHIYASH